MRKERDKMQDLTLVGLSEDKSRLVLVSDSGEEFSLPADAKLLAALRGDHARLGQLEIKMESTLRPRDIQARIRAGETPEEVAAAAQTTIDRIMGFATPVLAERAHIADRAQRSSVRRKAGEGPARLLGDAVAERLRERNIDPETVEWDSWRRDDGRWALVADYRSGENARHAEFIFDVPGRYVVAEDDEARWLVGEHTSVRGPQTRPGHHHPKRLTTVTRDDQQLPLGEDAIDMVSRDAPAAAGAEDDISADEEETVELGDVARLRPRRVPPAVPGQVTGDADWIVTQASDRPDRSARRTEAAEPPAEQSTRRAAEHESETVEGAEEAPEQPQKDAPAAAANEPSTPPPVRRPAKRRGRASVPSWDEIMFGGGRSE
jgi:hypothetical protein